MNNILNSLLFFIIIFFWNSQLIAQTSYQKLRKLEERVKYSYPDSLEFYANSIDTNSTKDKAIHLWAKGKAYYWKSDYPNAYIQLEEAAKFVERLNDKMLLGEIYLDLSSSLAVVDNHGKALSFILDAKDLFEEDGSLEQKSRASISLGELYRKIEEFPKAMEVLKEVLPKTEGLSYQKARCLNRIAAVFSETSKLDSSFIYSQRSLQISKKLKDPDLIATSENEIGYILRIQDKFQESLPHFFKADSLWRSAGMYRYAINPIHHAAVVYRSIGEVDKGLTITHAAYAMTKGRGWYQIEMNLLDDLKAMHDLLNNEDSVLFYDRARLEAAISFRTKQFEVNTRMVEVLYTQKENEQTIREQSITIRNEALEKKVINRERTTLWIIVSLIVIILFIIFIYAYNQRKLQKQLAQQNAIKERKNEELLIALGANEALVQEISHRVKNNLAVLAGLLTMQANRSDNDSVKKELMDSVLRIESIATIHKKLYDKRSDAKVNLKDALEELSRNVVATLGQNPDEVLETYLDNLEIDIAEAVTLCLIVNEAITNSCKYANVSAHKKIRVELIDKEGLITCKVVDHGAGFKETEVSRKSDSLGIYLIKLLTKQLRAQLKWEKTDKAFIMTIELNNG